MNPIEILAPVGNHEMLTAAVYSGADAVYLGYAGFNARSGAANFTAQTLADTVAFCHARGVRVHVALNTTVYASELEALAQAVCAVAQAGADAVIVQDLAAAKLVRSIAPGLALHGSTQMSVHTQAGLQQLARLGFSRAVLARELSLAEIQRLAENSPLETEVFIHGALCMSISGQCYLSAFLGGRSGNRGCCAGPCRLPFDASALPEGCPGQGCHLSLKDNSSIGYLRQLEQMGVASAKIEGRLRTPEYVAAVVNACRLARAGQPYDEEALRAAFSRSGFTRAYMEGNITAEMFGVRTQEDAAATKKILPSLRELYRRENSRVPVDLRLEITPEGEKLTASDDEGNRAIVYGEKAPEPAQNDPAEALKRSLCKTGGTPFVARSAVVEQQEGRWYIPGGVANELRRAALAALLQKRQQPRPHPAQPYVLEHFAERPRAAERPLYGRFACWQQVPPEALALLAGLILPLEQAKEVPAEYRKKVVLELPRAMFGAREQQLHQQLRALPVQAFAGVQCENLAHTFLARELPRYGGLGLNVTNPLAAQEYADLGLRGVLILPEVQTREMQTIAPVQRGQAVPTAAIVYGHLPLMLTRACPLQNVRDCAHCNREGFLTDRKARKFPVRCAGGVRTIYNPVPLYMGDKLQALPVDGLIAWFTLESRQQAAQVLELLQKQLPYPGEFTRGLYFKGTNGKE